MGRAGAIAANSAEFCECTAFLDYQSTHSDEVLGEYFKTVGVSKKTSKC